MHIGKCNIYAVHMKLWIIKRHNSTMGATYHINEVNIWTQIYNLERRKMQTWIKSTNKLKFNLEVTSYYKQNAIS